MKTEYVNILCENLLDIRDNFKTKIEYCLMIFTLVFKAKIFNKGIKLRIAVLDSEITQK